MQITKISRSYSRSINTRAYGAPESWVKIESVYEALVESTDDPFKVSQMLFDQAKTEVVANIAEVVDRIKASLNPVPPVTPPVTPPVAPVVPATGAAVPVPQTFNQSTAPSGMAGAPLPRSL